LSTWIEIYAHFRFESRNLLKVTGRFIQSLVYISKELSNEIQRASILQNYLSAIVDRIEDAVIALDHAEIIQFINHKATETLHLNGMALTGRTAAECLPADLYQLVSTLPNHEEHMLDWRGSTYFLRKMQILLEGQLFGTVILFRKADEIQKLEHDYRMRMTSNGLVAKYTFDDIHGQCSTFQKVLQIAKKVARSHSTVLLLGESGTGKELLAQAIHNASKRRKEPFVGVNFAAITESLLESELFGYEEGAFTGARKGGHIGWFEQAHKGTIFLDEIGDATWLIQNRLLRVLQERQLRRVGGTQVIPIDIRVIAATNQNLLQKVEDGTFRADLYYRLNILPIHLPPLRKRKEDIPQLAQLFITKYCAYLRRPKFTISPEGLRELLEYDWPGNIRELENVIEYLAHVVEDVMYPYHLPFFQNGSFPQLADAEDDPEFSVRRFAYQSRGFLAEMQAILSVLDELSGDGGRHSILARLHAGSLAITEQQLRYRLKILQSDGMIKVGRGRQGSSITAKGREFLRFLDTHR
jgi:transcriptional regulator with PAS, ATPase and Fis domain